MFPIQTRHAPHQARVQAEFAELGLLVVREGLRWGGVVLEDGAGGDGEGEGGRVA